MKKIVIVDYNICNVKSIQNILKKVGYKSVISESIDDIFQASHIILPGVGSFDTGIVNLHKSGLVDAIREQVFEHKKPILGICLGMHLLTNGSDEGKCKGLGWINSYVQKFSNTQKKIPHMGWNYVKSVKKNILIDDQRVWKFYFVHSYYVQCERKEDVIGETIYGSNFCSAFNCENIYGVQFHPEKSHSYGMDLFKSFIEG